MMKNMRENDENTKGNGKKHEEKMIKNTRKNDENIRKSDKNK